jgi:hypothetical protein
MRCYLDYLDCHPRLARAVGRRRPPFRAFLTCYLDSAAAARAIIDCHGDGADCQIHLSAEELCGGPNKTAEAPPAAVAAVVEGAEGKEGGAESRVLPLAGGRIAVRGHEPGDPCKAGPVALNGSLLDLPESNLSQSDVSKESTSVGLTVPVLFDHLPVEEIMPCGIPVCVKRTNSCGKRFGG